MLDFCNCSTVFEDQLENHLKKCNQTKKTQVVSGYIYGVTYHAIRNYLHRHCDNIALSDAVTALWHVYVTAAFAIKIKLNCHLESTSFPGLFPFELGQREKTLAWAGHVLILHPKILGVIN